MSQPVLRCPDTALVRVVIGDVHSDYEALRRLLEKIGVIDRRGQRQPGFWVVQLGDLLHLGHRRPTDDLLTMELAERARFDVQLAGNHELYFAYRLEAGYFARMHARLMPPLDGMFAAQVRAGRWQAATSVDGWLITHAGVADSLAVGLPAEAGETAGRLCALLQSRARRELAHEPLIDWVGESRGGRAPVGGIFYCDLSELVPARPALWPQIIGHSPRGDQPELIDQDLWVVDVGAGLSKLCCALVKAGAEGDWHPVVAGDPAPVIQG